MAQLAEVKKRLHASLVAFGSEGTTLPRLLQEFRADWSVDLRTFANIFGFGDVGNDSVLRMLQSMPEELVVLCQPDGQVLVKPVPNECTRTNLSLIDQSKQYMRQQEERYRLGWSMAISVKSDWEEHIHQMFLSGIGTDCVIECGTQQFSVHKFVLTAHSEVFRAMLTHKETTESKESRILIEDCAPTAVQHMLTYMYSGRLPDFCDEEGAQGQGLFVISDKYGLDKLKDFCESKLASELTSSNVCAMLKLADTHNADHLKSSCIPVVKAHRRELFKSPEWADLKSTNLALACSVLEKCLLDEE